MNEFTGIEIHGELPQFVIEGSGTIGEPIEIVTKAMLQSLIEEAVQPLISRLDRLIIKVDTLVEVVLEGENESILRDKTRGKMLIEHYIRSGGIIGDEAMMQLDENIRQLQSKSVYAYIKNHFTGGVISMKDLLEFTGKNEDDLMIELEDLRFNGGVEIFTRSFCPSGHAMVELQPNRCEECNFTYVAGLIDRPVYIKPSEN